MSLKTKVEKLEKQAIELKEIEELLTCKKCKSQLEKPYSEEGKWVYFSGIYGLTVVGLLKMVIGKEIAEIDVWECPNGCDKKVLITDKKSKKEIMRFER